MKRYLITVAILTTMLSACAGTHSHEKPLRHEATISGNPASLGHCVMHALHADTGQLMQLYHYRFRIYPDIDGAQIFAYDTRFLPYIYTSNSPQNPDAVRDYIDLEPEILPGKKTFIDAEYHYGFILTIQKADKAFSHAAIRGNTYVSEIAWRHVLACSTG